MAEQPTPLAVAQAFTEAWTSHDMDTAASYLAEDVVFDSPSNHSTGAKAYMEGLSAFAQRVTGMKMVANVGTDDQALIMYEVTTGPSSTMICAEHLTIRNGKIQADKLVFRPS